MSQILRPWEKGPWGDIYSIGGLRRPPQRRTPALFQGVCGGFVLPLDEGFSPSRVLPEPQPSPSTPGCRWWEGTAPGSVTVTWQSPWQCLLLCKNGEIEAGMEGGRKVGNKGAAGAGLGQSCDTRRVPSLPPLLSLLFLLPVFFFFFSFFFSFSFSPSPTSFLFSFD